MPCSLESSLQVMTVAGVILATSGCVLGEQMLHQDFMMPDQHLNFFCRYSARARGEVLALKLTQENYVRALAAMYYEAENGARAVANSTTASSRLLPGPTASSPGLLGTGTGTSNFQPGQAGSSGGGGMRKSASGSDTVAQANGAASALTMAAVSPSV